MIAFENFCLQPSTHYVQQASMSRDRTLLDALLAGFAPCRIRRHIRRYASDFGEFAKAVRRRNKFSSTRFARVNAGGQKWLILIISGSRLSIVIAISLFATVTTSAFGERAYII